MYIDNIRNDVETVTNWASALVAFNDAEYHQLNGQRINKKFYCKIRNTYKGTSYIVEGNFSLFLYLYTYVHIDMHIDRLILYEYIYIRYVYLYISKIVVKFTFTA